MKDRIAKKMVELAEQTGKILEIDTVSNTKMFVKVAGLNIFFAKSVINSNTVDSQNNVLL